MPDMTSPGGPRRQPDLDPEVLVARSAANLTDAALATVLAVWAPRYLNGYPVDRDHDARVTPRHPGC